MRSLRLDIAARLSGGIGAVLIAGVAFAAELSTLPAIDAVFVIQSAEIPPLGGDAGGVKLGGISDLFIERTAGRSDGADAAGMRLWAITDRGPNGTVKTAQGKRRTLVAPGFVPRIVRFDAPPLMAAEPHAEARLLAPKALVPLLTASGKPTSGRPNGVGRDEPILDHGVHEPLPGDPNGFDPEGIVVSSNGSFWIAEEYRPSLAHVAADGRVLVRLVPEGQGIPNADTAVEEALPAAYGLRKDNRGFESLAMIDGGRRLVAMVQSPLQTGDGKAGKRTGNVRMLVVDTETKRPVAEHVYRAGDPKNPAYATCGCPPDDVKICAMAAIDDRTLLVIEQGDDGSARLYAAAVSGATDTLSWSRQADGPPLEEIAELAAAGITPVHKRLVADLGPLGPRFRADARLGDDAPLKLEGIALLDDRRVAIVNDDDFAVHARSSAASGPRSCLWVVQLGAPVPTHAALTLDR